ncbi:MAG: DUF1573 domain-containing protein [Bacteroidetes bacterium]|nr:DUF1573 domain-containing protein [Bacteroidota bacterium]
MKRILFKLVCATFLISLISSCNRNGNGSDIPANVVTNPNTADGKADMNSLPVITFEKDFHDFGELKAGEKVTYSFKFRNTGKSLLVISNVTTSCGCTVSEYPHQPVKPGEQSTVDVSFDSEGKRGIQNKSVTVFTNTQPPSNILRIKAAVVEAEQMN